VTSFDLGSTAHECRVRLTRNGDFRTRLIQSPKEDPPDWPAGTNITLVIETQTFPFTIDGPNADLVIDKAVVNQMIEDRVTRAWLYYNSGDADEVWALGPVISSG
jgi:hypothetical protein